MYDPIVIVPFRSEHGGAFYTLNRAWLDEHELHEPPDEAQLVDPQGEILSKGGAIFVALRGDEVVGTAAIVPHGPGEVELAKLTVTDSARGSGLGRRLVERCIDEARAGAVQRMVLISNSRLRAALKLYEAMGFQHATMPESNPYKTGDVYMEMRIN